MLFKELIGQEQIISQLIGTVASNRVAHAQLFFGGSGRGKLKLAIAYAQFISCRDKDKIHKGDSCGTCPSCIKYNKLIHPDLHFVFPVAASKLLSESQKPASKYFLPQWREFLIQNGYYVSLNEWYDKIQIERKQATINTSDCNQIIHTLSYTSYESEYKVMIIWMIEKLYHAAAPRLLKILEEPPDKTVFLLVAEQTDLVISTILSRLHLVKVPPINTQSIGKAAVDLLQLAPDEANQIALLSNGSYKKAMLLHSGMEERQKTFSKFVEWMRMCYAPNVPAIMNFCDENAKHSREATKEFFQFSLDALRVCLMINMKVEEDLRIIPAEKEFYKKFSNFVHQENIEEFLTQFDKAIYHIERNVNASMVYLDLSLTIARLLKQKQTAMQK
jgi:DNA polymerase III subunit delta'